MRSRYAFLLAVALLVPSLTFAIKFPDVSSTYPHAADVENLSEMGIIGGNPDGTFKPYDPVNRAAMLKMLYLAANKAPGQSGGCFSDVQPGSWYEFIVCDAAKNGYVQGYDGKLFKPGQAVTRAEAIKMALVVFGIPEADLGLTVNMYADITPTDWHARYVHTALANGILPIPGQEGPQFFPGKLLERGEAAAYVWSAMHAELRAQPAQSSSSSVSSEATGQLSSAEAEIQRRAEASKRINEQEEAALRKAQESTRNVAVPFTDQRTFSGTETFSYKFSTTSTITVDIATNITDAAYGNITCRLYQLNASGFSQWYHLGFQENQRCVIRAALSPGNWRLELTPEKSAAPFSVSVQRVSGDGNDGFSQAVPIKINQVITADMGIGDLEDWYKFSVPKDADTMAFGGQKLLVRVTSTDPITCIIYPQDDVDQFGFVGPECGLAYLYPGGTYMVGVRHSLPLGTKQAYSIIIR